MRVDVNIKCEYGGWSLVFVVFLALNWVISVALCDGVLLLSCIIHELFLHKYSRFWRIIFTQTLEYGQILFFINHLPLWNKFVIH